MKRSPRWIGRLALGAALVALAPAARAQAWHVVARPAESAVRFSLVTTLHHVEGTAPLTGGELWLDTKSGEARGELTVDARALETGSKGRDRDMHQKVLESAAYPRIAFTAEHVAGAISADGEFDVVLRGRFEIHGESHPLVVTAHVRAAAGQATATTSFSVPYVAWGMRDPSKFVLRAEKEVGVEIDLAAELTPGET
jgi:polyisoprenoid-binding protein YceI